MPWPELPDSLDLLSDAWDLCPATIETSQLVLNAAWAHWNINQDHLAIQDTLLSLQELLDTVDNMLSYIFTFDPKTLLCKVLYQMRAEYQAGGYDLTMGDMLSTMLGATPSEVTYFVGLVDAYRQAIWNKPFNAEFFAALSRGFMEWE